MTKKATKSQAATPGVVNGELLWETVEGEEGSLLTQRVPHEIQTSVKPKELENFEKGD